jgi:hypothetical protein
MTLRDRGVRAAVKVWPQWIENGERRIITIGHGNYTPDEAEEFAQEILTEVRVGRSLLEPEKPIPPGWSKCIGIDSCPDAGKWGAGVDPNDHTAWTHWHAWHRVNANHGFVIHQREEKGVFARIFSSACGSRFPTRDTVESSSIPRS